MRMIPLEEIKSNDPMVRKVRESFFINKMDVVSKGLNVKSC